MATIIFDFDDTLYDNISLKQEAVNVFKDFDISEEDIDTAYKNTRDFYSYERHVEKIKEKHTDIDIDTLVENLNSLDFGKHLFPGIHEILNELNKKHKLILLTFGNEYFQRKKLSSTEIEKHFHHVYVTNKHKAETLKEIDGLVGDIYFINDKENENRVIEKEFPHFKIIQITPENPVNKINWQI